MKRGDILNILLFDEPSYVTQGVEHGRPAIDVVPYSTKYYNKPLKSQYKVYSPVDGTVVNAGFDSKIINGSQMGGGYFISILKDNGVRIFMCHFKDNPARRFKYGDQIRRGQFLAIMGSSGHSTGPHVHIQASKNGKLISMSELVSELGVGSKWLKTTIFALLGIMLATSAFLYVNKKKIKRGLLK